MKLRTGESSEHYCSPNLDVTVTNSTDDLIEIVDVERVLFGCKVLYYRTKFESIEENK